ncbi:ArsR/SmtB family transcription factor [Halobaculum halobium]|uniref:ArsR/SmtB family transcription factor n=1 Tax=Halobaculum halobium TaxID=3032281 RepID=A0ABD5TBH6_9EURY|nr:winged helix-turn-helix domain-containing protein [Halobaculum sp. SYNS20]
MNDRPDAAALAGAIEDDSTRTILVATQEEAVPVSELADVCGVSEPTVYRRLESLRERGLVEERTRLDEDGHHRGVYRATVERVAFDLAADGVDAEVTRRTSMADRFTDLVGEM